MKKLNLKKGEVLVLRTCSPDGSSRHGFVWPKSGVATCPDWKPNAECGNGLHGLKWGVGDESLLDWGKAAWLVVKVMESNCIDICGKVKFPAAEVVYFGDRLSAVALIEKHAPAGSVIVMGTATAGDRGTATAGYRGTATAGDMGTATAGEEGVISIMYWNGEYRCQICYTSHRLEVHHRTYERLGYEKPSDLTVLCYWCHRNNHDKVASNA